MGAKVISNRVIGYCKTDGHIISVFQKLVKRNLKLVDRRVKKLYNTRHE